MRRHLPATFVFAVAAVSAGFELAAQAANQERGQDRTEGPLAIGDRREPSETELLAFAKQFCVAMRRQHDRENVASMRAFLDPRYLREHSLVDGDFRLEMAAIGAIFDIQLADDNQTLLCYVQTGDDQKEAILLRVNTRDGKMYLSPAKRPAEVTNIVTPWLLRMKL